MKAIRHGAIAATALGAALCGGAAFADDPYVPEGYDYMTESDAAGELTSFNSAGKWNSGEAPQAGRKYFVPKGITMFTPSNDTAEASYTFAGDELRLTTNATLQIASGNEAGGGVTVNNLVLEPYGRLSFAAKRRGPEGIVTRVNHNGNSSFGKMLVSIAELDRDAWTTELPFTLKGDGKQYVFTETSAKAPYGASFALTGDLSGYSGHYRITERTALYVNKANNSCDCFISDGGSLRTWYHHGEPGSGYDVIMPQQTFSGTFCIGNGTAGTADISVATNSVLISKASTLLFYGNATVRLMANDETNGFFKIDNDTRAFKLRMMKNNAKIKVACDLSCATKANTRVLMHITNTNTVYRGLESEANLYTLSLDDFKFDFGQTYGIPVATPKLVSDGAKGAYLVVEHGPALVKQLVSCATDENVYTPLTSATNAAGAYFWSNHEAPKAGCDYYTNGKQFGIPESCRDIIHFAGDSLILNSSFPSGNKNPNCAGVWFKKLRLVSGAGISNWGGLTACADSYDKITLTIGGDDISVEANIGLTDYGDKMLRLAGPMTGTKSITMTSYNYTGNAADGRSNFEFTGINTNWTGKLQTNLGFHTTKRGDEATYGQTVPSEKVFITIYVTDGRNLGGPLSKATADALYLENYAMLRAEKNDVTLDQANRGIKVKYVGQFYAATNKTMTIQNDITMDGALWKQGAGTLALGGSLAFAGTTNDVVVKEGAIKALSKTALEGAAITTEANGAVAFDWDPTGDVKTYGVYNTSGSFEGDAINVALGTGSETLSGDKTLNLFTVANKAAAEALAAKLNFTVKPKASVVETRVVAQEGVYTVRATVKSAGLMIFMR